MLKADFLRLYFSNDLTVLTTSCKNVLVNSTFAFRNPHPSPGPLLKAVLAQRLALDLDFYK